MLAHSTPKGHNLFECLSLMQYQTLFKWLNAAFGLEGYSPHSPRAGFASEGMLSRKSFVELREEGRWTCDSSLRVYLDVIATAAAVAEQDSRQHLSLVRMVDTQFINMFRWWPGCDMIADRCEVPPMLYETLIQAVRA